MKKVALVLVGAAVMASTVYAVVLRATTAEPGRTAPTLSATAEDDAPLVSRTEPRTWGRLVMLDEPTVDAVRETAASPGFTMTLRTPPTVDEAGPGFTMTIRTPPMVIAGSVDAAEEAPANVAPGVVEHETADDADGVMAKFKAPPPPESNLPEAPDRAQIAKVMGSVRTEIQECYDRGMVPGQVDLVLTVEGESGAVLKANVSATSSTATCIQRVARTLRFPRFARESVTIRYPYSFR